MTRFPYLVADHWTGVCVITDRVGNPKCPEACLSLLVDRARTQLVPGRILPALGRLVHSLWDCGFQAPEVCFLVGQVIPEAGAGLLEGKTSNFPPVGRAGSCLAGVSWAMSRSRSGGGCELRKSLGS